MGIQEDVSVLGDTIGSASIFTIVVLIGTAFFARLSAMGMLELIAVRSDVIASSMSILSMHDDAKISFGWDHIPFSIGVTNGGIILVTEADEHPLSPYPEVIPVLGSETEGNFEVFSKEDPAEFNFTRLDEQKEVEVN